jgi:hypothetical protein
MRPHAEGWTDVSAAGSGDSSRARAGVHDGSEQTEDTSGFARTRRALKEGDFTTAAEGVGVDEAGSRDGLRR